MDKSKIYLDLSKCTEDERKSLTPILKKAGEHICYPIEKSDNNLLSFSPHCNGWNPFREVYSKQELTYTEFIKLFEGGEEENNGWIKIESELELPNDNEPMWVMIEDCELPELVQPDREADDFYGSDGVIYHSHHITHYQPIQKPLPPLY